MLVEDQLNNYEHMLEFRNKMLHTMLKPDLDEFSKMYPVSSV